MKGENKKAEMSVIPQDALELLYNLRLPQHFKVPFDEYVSWYRLIVVNDIAYYSDKCDEWRLKDYMEAPHWSIKKATLPDAVVNCGSVSKNRFGRIS